MHHALDLSTSDDGALLAAAAAGSREALGELYVRHATAAFRTAYRVLGSRSEAEDVVHDVFVALPAAGLRCQEQGAFHGWLKTVVTRAALKRLRTPWRRRVAILEDAPEPAGADPVDSLALESALRTMPDVLRVVFMLKAVEGYSHAEVASLLGISRVASRVRLHRAWGYLRERLGTQ